jgi:uncharacterized membrane protein YraQ (UPF0718 family)
MNGATAILALACLALLILAKRRADGSLGRGLSLARSTAKGTAPLLLLAFALVGYVQVLAPQDLIQHWIGPASGARGLLVGEIAGMLLPGGPYIVYPLIAALYEAGAGLGPVITMVTSWSALGLLSVSFELPFLGWRFSLLRLAITLPVPLIAGVLAQWLFSA